MDGSDGVYVPPPPRSAAATVDTVAATTSAAAGASTAEAPGTATAEGTGAETAYAVPALYLLRSASLAIKLQAGGRVRPGEAGETAPAPAPSADGGEENEEEKGGVDEEAEEYVPSQALCVAVAAGGDSPGASGERAFDFVVPAGEWVHLAFVAKRVGSSA